MSDYRSCTPSPHRSSRKPHFQGEHRRKRSRSPTTHDDDNNNNDHDHDHDHRHQYRHYNDSNHKRSKHHIEAEQSHHRQRHRHHHKTVSINHNKPKSLPLNAAPISKHDLSVYEPLFALYLDIQKRLDIEELHDNEVRGRWKSFVKKWNAGDLAEGWYDTATLEKAQRGTFGLRDDQDSSSAAAATTTGTTAKTNPRTSRHTDRVGGETDRFEYKERDQDSDDSDFGPRLPATLSQTRPRYHSGATDSEDDDNDDDEKETTLVGPSIPSTSDLRAHHEQQHEEAVAAKARSIRDTRIERAADRKLQRDRLEELAPRAEPGSRERRLEKRREVAASNRAFAAAKDGGGGGGDLELRDAEVMGEADSLEELRRIQEIERRKKTEREVRREEILRTRVAEREERMKGLREKEAKTMEMLKSIARSRFGSGGGQDHESSGN